MPLATGSTAGPAASSRPPVWMLTLGLLFLGYYSLLCVSDLSRPEPLGVSFQIERLALVVRSVEPGSLAARAGLTIGDRVLTVNSHPTRTRLDWMAVEMNLRTHEPVRLDVERRSAHLTLTLNFERTPWRYWITGPGITLLIARLFQLVTLALALLVAFKRPFDTAARVGAWVLATVGVYSITWQYQLAAIWRSLPMPVGAVLWIPFAGSLAIAAVVLTFFATFPRPVIRNRLVWPVIWLPMVVVLALQLQYALRVVYQPARTDPFFDWTTISAATATGYTVAAVVVLVLGYRRLTDVTERRRVRVLVVGSSVGLLSVVTVAATYWGRSPSTFGDSVFASPAAAIGAVVGLALPISFAYSILRYRLFDIRLMLRLGLQYALARRVVVSFVPILGALFFADLWVHRQTPFAEILQARGWVYAGLAIFALVARVQRDQWLDALDRTYFRERLNAQRLLRGIGEEIRHAGGLDAVAPRVVIQIETALHAEFVALLACAPGHEVFRTLAVSPASHVPLSLAAASKAIELVRLIGKPVQLADRQRTWMLRHLPAADVEWLSRANVELIVPIQLGGNYVEAVFVLGPKRSEEPYSAEDDDLLMAIADNVAWVLRRAPAPKGGRDAFEECSVCGACFAIDTGRCPNDGSVLTTASLPRVLADRYKLERRVGRGGMGAVYAAFDRALNRDVAVKVLREDLLLPAAVERFKSEARLAAALAHRNVVTVHDIGVTDAGRAFFIMELLNGVTLREELLRARRLPPARVLHILRDVGSGIEAAHRRQMIHRDLKPENVILCRDENVEVAKVLDFGLAKAVEVSGAKTMLTAPGMVAGTLQYMAPEHLSGGEASPDWDLWALAVMAFEMITGALPAAGTPRATDLAALPTDGLRELFVRALSTNPIDRPATVAEFLDELGRELRALNQVGSGH